MYSPLSLNPISSLTIALGSAVSQFPINQIQFSQGQCSQGNCRPGGQRVPGIGNNFFLKVGYFWVQGAEVLVGSVCRGEEKVNGVLEADPAGRVGLLTPACA